MLAKLVSPLSLSSGSQVEETFSSATRFRMSCAHFVQIRSSQCTESGMPPSITAPS